MKLIFKKFFQVGLFFTALMLCLFGFIHSDYITPTYLALYTLGLAHHLIFDVKKSKLFISVFILFIISSSFKLLELGLFCISLVFIYIYCTSSKLIDVLERERFI